MDEMKINHLLNNIKLITDSVNEFNNCFDSIMDNFIAEILNRTEEASEEIYKKMESGEPSQRDIIFNECFYSRLN